MPAFRADEQVLAELVEVIKKPLGVSSFELDIEFVDTQSMTELNKQYRNKDRSTDVLSFPQIDWKRPLTVETPFQDGAKSEFISAVHPETTFQPLQLLGDIVISLGDAQDNAKRIGHGLDREVAFLIIHGLLHLCGHDHKEPEEERLMLEQQKQLLELTKPSSQGGSPIWFNCVRVKA